MIITGVHCWRIISHEKLMVTIQRHSLASQPQVGKNTGKLGDTAGHSPGTVFLGTLSIQHQLHVQEVGYGLKAS